MDCPDIRRRTFASGMAWAAACLASPVVRSQPRLEKVRVTLAIGEKAALSYLPLTIAEQLGYFKAEGLEVEISEFADEARALQAVIGGIADVVSGSFESTINLQSKGQKFQAFVLQSRAPAISMGVSHRTIPQYRTVADLKGKKIGISTPGSSSSMVASLILSRAGLKAADVNFVGLGTPGAALSALRAGQIDALSNCDPLMTTLEQKGEIRIIADTRTLKGTADLFGGAMPASCLYAPADFIQKHPQSVQALTYAMVRGLKWLQTAGPSDIIKTVPEHYLLGDRALYLAAFAKVREAISPDGVMPEEGPLTAVKALAAFDPMIKLDKIELSKIYTNEFAVKAKERFRA